MSARFASQFYSAYTQQQYSVIVYDVDYTDDPQSVTAIDCQVNYPPGNAGRFDTVMAAELTIKLLIDSSGLDTFVEDLAGAREGRFLISLVQGITPVFIGYILPDLAQQEDTTLEVGYVMELKATDGLARLKTIDYNDDGDPYTGEATIVEHILNCLNKLEDLLIYYSNEAWILRTRINWIAQQHAFSAEAQDPADYTRIPHRAFYMIDTRGNYKYKTCFEVLDEICKAWGARMFYSNYHFWFFQVNEYASAESLKIWNYTKAGTQTSSSAVDFLIDHTQEDSASDLVRLSGGVFRFYPPLMKVQVDYRHIATRNLLSWWNGGTPETGVILDDYNATGRLNFTSVFTWSVTSMADPSDLPLWAAIELEVRVGTQYLRRHGTISGGIPNYETMQWTSTDTDRYVIFFPFFAEDVEQSDVISFITPALAGPGEFEFNTTIGQAYRFDGTLYAGVALFLIGLQNPYLELLFEGTLSGQSDIRRFTAVNNTAGNSAMLELTTLIGDGIGTNSPGHLEAYDGANWVLASGWAVGASGTYLDFSGLLAQEIVRGQLRPVRRYFGRYHNRNSVIYLAHNVIDHASGYMVFSGGTFRPAIDEVDGEWYYISPAASGWTNEPYLDIPGDQSDTAGRPSGGGGSSGGGGGGTATPLRIFRQEFTGVTGTDITVTVNGGVLPTNPAGVFITFNGQTITTADWSASGAVITFTFSLEASDIVQLTFFIQ